MSRGPGCGFPGDVKRTNFSAFLVQAGYRRLMARTVLTQNLDGLKNIGNQYVDWPAQSVAQR